MKSIIRILFAMLILATIFVPLQAALTPSPSTSTTPVAAVATKTIGDRHPLHPLALPADITAATPAELQASPEASPRARAKRSKVVYLTFDDGPGGAYTLEVLADLQAAGAHGTFFETGDCTAIGSFGGVPDGSMYPTSGMNINPAIPAQLLAAGNQIGTHSWDHPDFPTLKTAAAANAEIGNARALQVRLTGHDSKLFRYPFRDPSLAGNQYLRQQGMKAVPTGIEPNDWDPAVTDAALVSTTMAQVFNGAIVDLHDATDVLARVHPTFLPLLLTQLKKAGYKFGTIAGA